MRDMTNLLICNAGSSSIKFSLIRAQRERTLAEAEIEWSTESASLKIRRDAQAEVRNCVALRTHADAVARVLSELRLDSSAPASAREKVSAVGHRVVHGGERYTAAVLITPDVQNEINRLAELAPLHNSASLQVINAVQRLLPGVPQVAAFDTAFHATLPEAARTYPLPHTWTPDWGLRRYGFHGLSHSYCAARAAEMIAGRGLRIIVAHLGNGASVSAVRDGLCVDTSMGFTPLDGLMMGTRSGSVDPGILIHVLRHKGLSVDQLDHALNHESGLLGVSGVSSDMREVLDAEDRGESRARLAIEIYVHRVQQTIGAMAATLGGVDGLVFTAGVGEHAAVIRDRVCENLGHLGLQLNRYANLECKPDADIATATSKGRILVIATREDLAIAREIQRLIPSTEKQGALS
jgi:acetate kinase